MTTPDPTADDLPPVPRDLYESAFADLRARCTAARGRNQVLIVDDDVTVATLLRDLIRHRCPLANVVAITNPEAALRAIATGAWAVVVADVHLQSKITGGTIAEAAPRTTDVFFFTGHDEDLGEVERALRVKGTLRKPLSLADEQRLVDTIAERLGGCESPDADADADAIFGVGQRASGVA